MSSSGIFMSMSANWKIKAEFESNSFEGVKHLAKNILGRIANAKNYKEIACAGGGGGGNGYSSYRVSCFSPIEARIQQLRQEADELEATFERSKS